MALAFRTTEVKFNPSKGDAQTERGFVVFNARVREAEASIKGFEIGYTEGDHELYKEMINIFNVRPEGETVSFEVEFGLRDDSGNWDDPYSGQVTVLVMADLHDSGGD